MLDVLKETYFTIELISFLMVLIVASLIFSTRKQEGKQTEVFVEADDQSDFEFFTSWGVLEVM